MAEPSFTSASTSATATRIFTSEPGSVSATVGVGAGQMQDIAGELNRGDLHAQAQAKIGHAMFAGIFGGDNLALDPALAEAAGDEDAPEPFEDRLGAELLDLLRLDGYIRRDAGFGDQRLGQLRRQHAAI